MISQDNSSLLPSGQFTAYRSVRARLPIRSSDGCICLFPPVPASLAAIAYRKLSISGTGTGEQGTGIGDHANHLNLICRLFPESCYSEAGSVVQDGIDPVRTARAPHGGFNVQVSSRPARRWLEEGHGEDGKRRPFPLSHATAAVICVILFTRFVALGV